MSTNAELTKENKELKRLVRELRSNLKTHVPKEDELTESNFCIVKIEKDHFLCELKMNPETDEIMIVSKSKMRTRDHAIILQKGRQHLVYHLMGKDRSVLKK